MTSGEILAMVAHFLMLLVAVGPFVLLRKKQAMVKYSVLVICLIVAGIAYWGYDVWILGLVNEKTAGVHAMAQPCYDEVEEEIQRRVALIRANPLPPNTTDDEIKALHAKWDAEFDKYRAEEEYACFAKYWDQWRFDD